jgi:iduronate 2-sulfatase
MRGPATEAQDVADDQTFDGKQTAGAIEKMRLLATGQSPFFIAIGYIRPHLPFVSPKKYWDLYDRARIPLAANGHLPKGMPPVAFGSQSMGGFYELRGYMDYAGAPSPFDTPLSEAQQRELKHGYYASVSFIDAQVGRLLDELDRSGLAKNTIVILWSDHGWKLGEHGGWCKQTNYEIDTRAPLLIRAPGAKANGQGCSTPVEFVDIYPTLCDLAGVPIPKQLEGRSLAPLLQDVAAPRKDAAFSQFSRKHEGRDFMGYAMRTNRHRYVEWLDAKTGEITAQELYDHDTDPGENENIAARPEHFALLTTLSTSLWTALPRPKLPFPFAQPAVEPGADPVLTWHPANGQPLPASKPAGEFRSITFKNSRPEPAKLIWLGPDETRKSYATLKQNDTFSIRTRPGAVWLIQDAKENALGHFVVEDHPAKSASAVIPPP